MPSNPTLPLEIIQTIITSLEEDDPNYETLKVCSLTCRTFLHLCRKHIFGSIFIEQNASFATMSRLTRFINLISTSPEIADYIRQLHLYIPSSEFTQPLLPAVLTAIRKLKTLSICWPRYQCEWQNNPLRDAILHLLHLPTLVNLELQDIDGFNFSDLAPSVGLKSLELTCIKVRDSDIQRLSSQKPIQLRRLSFGIDISTVLEKILTEKRFDGTSIFDFSTLTSISFEISEPRELEAAQDLLKLCGQLHDILLELSSFTLSCSGLAIALGPSMESLRHLRVEILVQDNTRTKDPLSGLALELDKIRANQNHIQTIIIGVSIDLDYDCHRGDRWGILDRVMTETGWPMLVSVSLDIRIFSFRREFPSGLEAALKALPESQFPRLSSKEFQGTFKFSAVEERV